VINWYRSELSNRDLFKVSFANGKRNCNGVVGPFITGDHPFLTQRGWVQTSNLLEHDLVATGTPSPGIRGEQIIIGSLLGDAGIHAGVYSEGHSIKQSEYINLKFKVLSNFPIKIRELLVNAGNKKKYKVIRFDIGKSYYFHDLQNLWYPNGKKTFPIDAIYDIVDLPAIAVWYIDDGHYVEREFRKPKCEIALGKIDEKTAKRIPEFIKSKFGFKSYLYFNQIWRLKFRSGNDTIQFLSAIAQFIPLSMRYKLPKSLYNTPFNSDFWQPEDIFTHWRQVIIQKVQPRVRDKILYCIDVKDTANFITTSGVVHNCFPQISKTPTKEHIRACSKHLMSEIEELKPIIILTFGNTGLKFFKDKDSGITEYSGKAEWNNEYNCWIYYCVHPAAVLHNPNNKQKFSEGIEEFVKKLKMIGGSHLSKIKKRHKKENCPYDANFETDNNEFEECGICELWEKCAKAKSSLDWR